MKLVRNLLVAVSLVSVAGVAVAADKKADNCEVKGKKKHAADEAACKKMKGKWLGEAAATATTDAAAPATTTDAAAPAAAPAAGDTTKK